MKRITLQRQVFEKEKYLNTIDNSFKELKSEPDPNFFDRDLAVLSDFWYLYEKFFYNIPKLGVIESHEYLTKTSGEFANAEFISEQVQSLLDEIVVLREENLKLLEENINLKTPEQQAGNGISGNKFNTDVAGMAVTNINRS